MIYLSKNFILPIDQPIELEKIIFDAVKGKVSNIRLHRQSIDARRKPDVKKVFSCTFEYDGNLPQEVAIPHTPPINVLEGNIPQKKCRVLVVGGGPAGLFCALAMAKGGAEVTLIDRGGGITERQAAVDSFRRGGALNTHCNVQFGLGGAGAFSDGKLTTGTNTPYNYTVFAVFHELGAPDEIMTSSTPHIGTDNLSKIIKNFEQRLSALGVTILTNTTLLDIDCATPHTCVLSFAGSEQKIIADKVVLATGHSARDVFSLLHKKHVDLQPKPFSMGVRIEHDRQFINNAQYGGCKSKNLPTADYKMAVHLPNGRSAYTFCMCPGGVVIASASETRQIVTNGMSNFDRMAANSNAALLINIDPKDYFTSSPLDGVYFQQQYEELSYTKAGGNSFAPCQNVTDFLQNKLTTKFDVAPSYLPGVTSVKLDEVLPDFLAASLRLALPLFDNKIRGYAQHGVMTAIESRSSSPVKILRGNNCQCSIPDVYPVGEGAGYAGGIISSASDGLRVAFAILNE